MPFTEKGITPDLIINPNAIPSRMTIGQLIECLLGKVGAIKGHECDGTAFTRVDIEAIKDELEKMGYERNGSEYMYNGFNGQKMQSLIFVGPTYYQRLKHLVNDKVHCIEADTTDVLTISGWKKPVDITMDDQIATLKDGKLVYEKPIKLFDYPEYSGEMYSIKSQQIDLKVTGNHRMWVSKQSGGRGNVEWQPHDFEYAHDIVGKHRKYKKDAEWDVPDYQFILPAVHTENIPDRIVNTTVWLYFFGIWINKGVVDQTDTLTIRHCGKHIRDLLQFILPKLGCEFVEYDECNVASTTVVINNKQLYSYMEQFNAPNKCLPQWVWQLSTCQAKLLLEIMIQSNNAIDSSVFKTTSKRLADDIMRLCLHCGYSSNITTDENSNVIRVERSIAGNTPAVNGEGDNHVETLEIEKCHVFCLEVPSGVFYVRRNGKGVWTGNSRSRGPRTLLLHQPSEGRSRGGGMRIGEMERDALIAHGVSKYIKEKLMDTSDIYTTYVCDECGLFAQRMMKNENKVYSTDRDVYYCPACNNKTHISKIVIPYAFKLLVQELMAMCVAPRIHTVNDKYTN